MAQQTSFIHIRKKELIFYATLGPAVALLLGVIFGIEVGKDPQAVSVSSTQALFHEITSLNIKNYRQQLNFTVPSSKRDDILTNDILKFWRRELDKVDVLSYSAHGKRIFHIIGYLFGSKERDRFVILGNNRNFENTGTPVVMELVRSLGQLAKTGNWQPRRSIVFCSFGGVSGTDNASWVNALDKTLFSRGVVYFDINNVIQGNSSFSASGTPSLRKAVFETAEMVTNPSAKESSFDYSSVYDTWLQKTPDKGQPQFPLFEFPSSQNAHQIILLKTGLPYLSLRYDSVEGGGTSQVSNMATDIFSYDPDGKFSLAIAHMFAHLTLKFASERILPFNPSDYFYLVDKIVSLFLEQYAPVLQDRGIHCEHLKRVMSKFESTVFELQNSIKSIDRKLASQVRILNDKLSNFDRVFLEMMTLYSNDQHHHVLFGVKTAECPECHHLPRVRRAILNAMLHDNWNEVMRQLSILTFYIDTAATTLSELT